MIEDIGHGITKIEIPLPDNPLKALNSYFIRGKERNLLIDLGFNREECLAGMQQAMEEIGFSMRNTDIFLTHLHADHTGLTSALKTQETRVFAADFTADFVEGESLGIDGDFYDYFVQTGLIEAGLILEDYSKLPSNSFRSDPVGSIERITDGHVIEVGDMHLICIETSGHCPDHMCLYEPERKLLFSGDHILGNITPNNTYSKLPWDTDEDNLGDYLRNLDKIAGLGIDLTLPAHRKTIENCYQRITELKDHHQRRLDFIIKALGPERMSAVEVARLIPWSIRIDTWNDFPKAQKFFSAGEALSHLMHLVSKGALKKELENGIVLFSNT